MGLGAGLSIVSCCRALSGEMIQSEPTSLGDLRSSQHGANQHEVVALEDFVLY